MLEPPPAREIVRELGGPERVGRYCWSKSPRGHLGKAAVSMWTVIPKAHCLELQVLARYMGLSHTKHSMRPDLFPEGH